MRLYNSKRELVDFDDYYYFDEGTSAQLFKKDDEVLKFYKYSVGIDLLIGKKIFKKLKELNVPHIVNLHDYYYIYDSKISRILPPDAYTMDYVSEKKEPLLDRSTDYLLEMADKLEETGEILTENKIHIRDPHSRNIIFSKDNVTLIDVDTYEFDRIAKYSSLKRSNQRAILEFFVSTLKEELKEDYKDDYIIYYHDLFCLDVKRNKTVRESLEQLINENTPRKSLVKRKNLY